MNAKKAQEEKDNFEDEYERIAENEMIYFDEIALWDKLRKITFYLGIFMFVPVFGAILTLPKNTQLLESFSDYPLQISTFWVGYASIFALVAASYAFRNKVSTIKSELGLHKEEHLYLRAYEAHLNLDSFLGESNAKRKLYFKRLALQNANELTDVIDGWKYGNIRLIANLIGDKIDLLKDNMKRLVLSNVAKGDEKALTKVSKVFSELCGYIHSPSIEKLDKLNDMIKEIPFKEYKYLTKRERMERYFYSKPRMFRLLFAFGVAIPIAVVLLCLGQSTGIIFAVVVTCFWGAFAGFDKLFGLKKE